MKRWFWTTNEEPKECWDIRFKKIALQGAIQIKKDPVFDMYHPPTKDNFIVGYELFITTFGSINSVKGLCSSSMNHPSYFIYEELEKFTEKKKIEFLRAVGTSDAKELIKELQWLPFWRRPVVLILLGASITLTGNFLIHWFIHK